MDNSRDVSDQQLAQEDGKPISLGADGSQENKNAYYTLPKIRFTTLIQSIVFLDLVSSIALWLCGGDGTYLETSVKHFTIRDSVFDLAILGFVKGSILFFVFIWLEDVSLEQINQPYEPSLLRRKRRHHFTALFWSIASLTYCITKGVLVYEARTESAHHLHPTYYALAISSVVFSFFESCFAIMSFRAMRKLKLQRILHTSDNVQKKKGPGLRRLISLAKPEAGILAIASLALLMSSTTNIVMPFFFGKVIEAAVTKGMAQLNETVLILLMIYVVGAFAAMVRSWLYTLAGQRLVARIRKVLFNSIMKQEVAFFDTNRTGELINRLSSDTQVIQNALTANISMLLRYSLQILGSIIFMFTLSPKLTGVLISMVPIVGIGAQRYGKALQNLRKKFQDELAKASATSEESIGNLRTVRSFSQEPKAMKSYAEDIDKSYKVGAQLALMTGGFQGVMGIFAQGAVVMVLWYGGKLVNEKELSVGILTAFMLYTLNVAMAFAFLSSLYGDFMQAVGASIRMFELIDRVPAISMEGERTLSSVNQTIAFHNVFFHYPSRTDTDVLKDMSFKIEPGETVALVGPSGGGKSTVISLLERFYDPVSGRITIGDADVFSLDLYWMRKKIGLVSQEPVLFATTIAANIAYGKDASQEEIEDAARQANAHEFISTFEEGYQTEVGERGVKLSGGQKQRVAIARALLMDPEILLLDEATSALDAESEHFVKEAIDRAMNNRTVLVIAHRLSTVRNAQQVLVVDKGRIVERGTHRELLAEDGVYKKLVLRQLSTSEGGGVNMDEFDETSLEPAIPETSGEP